MASPNESKKLHTEENDNTLQEQTPNPPTGWLIELPPKPGGKQQDQKVAYPWTEMMKKRGKKKRTNEPRSQPQSKIQSDEPEPLPVPQPLTELQPKREPQPVLIVWYLESAEENRWIPEVPNAERYRSRWWDVSSFTTSNQFFHECLTGKLFRSMKEVSKRLGSSDNSTINDESADAVAHTLSAVMKRRGKRKRPDKPQPPQQPEIQHEPGPHTHPEVEPQVQPQPQREQGPEPFAHNNPPISVVWNLQPAEEKRWIPEVPNAEHYRSLWWEVSGFTSSNPNTNQAGGSGQAWRK